MFIASFCILKLHGELGYEATDIVSRHKTLLFAEQVHQWR